MYTFNTENLHLFDYSLTEWFSTINIDEITKKKTVFMHIYSKLLKDAPKYSTIYNRLHIRVYKDTINDKEVVNNQFHFKDNYLICPSSNDCYITISFDGEQPKQYKIISSVPSNILIKSNFEVEEKIDFINKLLVSKQATIEFQTATGYRKYEFDTVGLKF